MTIIIYWITLSNNLTNC